MEVAAGAMGPVIRKLGELLVGEYNLEKRVKKGIQSLLTELEMMHVVLRKVGEVPSDQLEEQVRIWAGKVRDLSCDMEDAVDDFLVRVDEGSSSKPTDMRSRVKKFLKKTTTLFGKGKALHQICDAIKEAQDLAKELADLRKKYELDMCSTTNGATIDPRVLALHVGELVGIEHTRDELVKTLICEDGGSEEQLKTISIVGVGGLGKTTLTKAVYEKIKAQFDCVAFVPVGQNPDIHKVFKDILFGLDKVKFRDIHNTTKGENLLIEDISEFLVDKRYLIVIDDIWDEEIWRYINCALYKNKLHSRVITTTRNVNVSEACLSSNDDMIHRMKPLSDEDSQILFHRRIFQSEEKCPEDLQIVSRDILKKCGGVPLAIITIASLLVSSQRVKPKHEWMHVYSSMGRGVTQNGIAKDMKRILSLSYYDLPSHLKTCLLYLSIFPEDFEIKKNWLIWRWLAEGFIQCDKEETRLFEIGESYFNELMNRSLIQPAKINEVIDRMRESWVPPPHLRSFVTWDCYGTALFLRLPRWVNSTSLPHLSTLSIEVLELQADDIQIIGMLPALRCLELRARRVMETLVVSADAFPYATCCKFERFLSPPSLFPPGAMPRVEHLQFEVSTPSITSGEVDCGLGHLPSVEQIKVILRVGNCSFEESEAAQALLRRATEAHPKRPTIEFELLISRSDQPF